MGQLDGDEAGVHAGHALVHLLVRKREKVEPRLKVEDGILSYRWNAWLGIVSKDWWLGIVGKDWWLGIVDVSETIR